MDAARGQRDGKGAPPAVLEGRSGDANTAREDAERARILLVEDEPGIVDFVRRGFEADGFAVESALDGVQGERLALAGSFDAIVLDLMLPGRDGLEVLASVRRAKPEVPVIVLTARGEIEDRVAGWTPAPWITSSSRSRSRSCWREYGRNCAWSRRRRRRPARRGHRSEPADPQGAPRRCSMQLSSTEFELLVYLLRHCGQVLSREQILSAVWGYEHDPATNVVDVYIGYLRRKLALRDDPAPIYTVRAVGYRLGGAPA